MKVSDKGGADFEPIPAGQHPARAIHVIDMGTQHWSHNGKPKATRKVRISFELPNEKRIYDEAKGEEPAIIGIEFTASLNEKANLRKFLQSWRGKPFTEDELGEFDVARLLGARALINVVHAKKGDKTYANIDSIMALPKAMHADLPEKNVLPLISFELDAFDRAIYDRLPEWIRNKIAESDEFKAMQSGNQDGMDQRQPSAGTEPDDDEIEF